MTNPTITKELAALDLLTMAVDAMQDGAEVEGPRVILGPVALERFAQAIYKLGRNAALDEAKFAASIYGPNRPIVNPYPSVTVRGRWEGEQAASSGIAHVIESLKDNTP